ncbi:MAG TPA: zinc-binding dehydrogenase [Acidimicrobiales bacterium]
MHCVVIEDGKLAIVERETPDPGPLDVVVAVRAAGINNADLMQRAGFYPAPEGWPVDVPGMEMAGVVSAVGDRVHEPLLGRRVCAIVGGGAQASHCLVPSEHLLFVPDHVRWDEAGGFPEAFTTAHDALVTQGQLRAGERVLISGAAGGVGVAAVQIARALGAHVIAVTRTSEHFDALMALGADETVTLDQVADVERVDVVLELVGAAHLAVAQYLLKPFARIVVIGVGGSGAKVELDMLAFMGTRSTLTGSTLRSRSRKEKGEVADRVNHTLIPRWRTREFNVPIAKTFSLDEVSQAYEYFARPGKFGKVVLRLDE